MPILPGMLNPGCCCIEPAFDCKDRDEIRDDILAFPLEDYTADFSGSALMYAVQESSEAESLNCSDLVPNPKCWSFSCCIACGGNNDTCTEFNCYQHETRNTRTCFNASNGVVASRQFRFGDTLFSQCTCIGPPNPCTICTGFTGCSFTSNGLDSLTPPAGYFCGTAGLVPCPPGFGSVVYDLGYKREVVTVGTTTTTTEKRLRLSSFQRSVVGGEPTCHLSLTLDFCLKSSRPFSSNTAYVCGPSGIGPPFVDGFSQNQRYFREWNGTDNALAFLATELLLQTISWNYALCPFDNVNGDTDYCFYHENFVPSDCGSVSVPYPCAICTPAQLDLVVDLYTPNTFGATTSCDVAMNPIVDPDFQPWQTVPATITVI